MQLLRSGGIGGAFWHWAKCHFSLSNLIVSQVSGGDRGDAGDHAGKGKERDGVGKETTDDYEWRC